MYSRTKKQCAVVQIPAGRWSTGRKFTRFFLQITWDTEMPHFLPNSSFASSLEGEKSYKVTFFYSFTRVTTLDMGWIGVSRSIR